MGRKSKAKRKANPRETGAMATSSVKPFPKWMPIICFLLPVALYLNTITHDYAFDDYLVIRSNQFTQMGLKGIPKLLTTDFFVGIYGQKTDLTGGRYRPLSLVTYAIEYELFGFNPHVSHAVNILLYGLTGWLLFLLLHALLGVRNTLTAFLATLFFIVHPVHTEVVANIKSRDEILCLLGVIIALYYFLKFIDRQGKYRYLLIAIVAFFMALLAKETAITFLAVIPIMLYCFRQLAFKKIAMLTLPWFGIAVVYLLMRTAFVGMVGDRITPDLTENPFYGASLPVRIATIAWITVRYLWLLIFPHTLSYDYSYNQIPWLLPLEPKAIAAFMINGLLLAYAVYRIREKDIIAFSILFFYITYSITSNLVFNIGTLMAERFIYIPSLGFCLALAVLLVKGFRLADYRTLIRKPVPLSIIALLLVAGSVKTIARNPDWKNNETLFTADMPKVMQSAKAHNYYGNMLLKKAIRTSDPVEKERLLKIAEQHFLKALEIYPGFVNANYNLGLAYQHMNKGRESVKYFRKSLRFRPDYEPALAAIGSSYGKLLAKYDSAVYYLEKAVSLKSDDTEALQNLGIAYSLTGQYDKAIATFERTIQIKPRNARYYLNLAIAYAQAGNKQKADEYFNKAFSLDPSLRQQFEQ